VVVEGHGILPTVVSYAKRGAREKNTPNNGGRGPKNAGEQI